MSIQDCTTKPRDWQCSFQTSQAGSFGRHLKEAPWIPRIDDNNDDAYDESKKLSANDFRFTIHTIDASQ